MNTPLERGTLVNYVQAGMLWLGMVSILAIVGGSLAGVEGVVWAAAGGAVVMLILLAGAMASMVQRYHAERLATSLFPLLDALVEDLALKAGLSRSPELYCIPSQTCNAFALGSRRKSAIAITEGMLERLEPDELLAVLAHEISHIQHGDTRLMGLADILSRVAGVMAGVGGILLAVNAVLWFNGLEPFAWGAVLLLLLSPLIISGLQVLFSRQREYRADRSAVALTRDPGALASALQKLHTGDFLLIDYLLPASGSGRSPSLLRRHPPNHKRVQRLLSMMAEEVPPLHMTPGRRELPSP